MYDHDVWELHNSEDLWVYDKLLLSRALQYSCGPVGMDVPRPGYYIVRPVLNILGLGLGTSVEYIEDSTDHLPPGYFWCERFFGNHYSIDYYKGTPTLSVRGVLQNNSFQRWERWTLDDVYYHLPSFLLDIAQRHDWMCCEWIGGNLIEVHLRRNPDFAEGYTEYIPVWQGEDCTPPTGYRYIQDPEPLILRIGAFVKI